MKDYYKKMKNNIIKKINISIFINLIMNIIASVFSGISILVSIYSYVVLYNLSSDLLNSVNNVDKESVVSGYEILGRIIGGGLSSFLSIIMIVCVILTIIAFILYLTSSITGYKWRKANINNEDKSNHKNYLIINNICNSIITISTFALFYNFKYIITGFILIYNLVILCSSLYCLYLRNELNK